MIIWKVLSFIGIAAAAYFLFRRAVAGEGDGDGGDPQPARARARAKAEDLVQCAHCGAYRPANRICDCQRAPTL